MINLSVGFHLYITSLSAFNLACTYVFESQKFKDSFSIPKAFPGSIHYNMLNNIPDPRIEEVKIINEQMMDSLSGMSLQEMRKKLRRRMKKNSDKKDKNK